jgi:hypothetical protein
MDQAQNNAPAQQVQPQQQPAVQNMPQVLPVVPPAGQVPIVQAQVIPNPNGNMDLKIQQTKLPEFWGQKRQGLHLRQRICKEGGQNDVCQQLV